MNIYIIILYFLFIFYFLCAIYLSLYIYIYIFLIWNVRKCYGERWSKKVGFRRLGVRLYLISLPGTFSPRRWCLSKYLKQRRKLLKQCSKHRLWNKDKSRVFEKYKKGQNKRQEKNRREGMQSGKCRGWIESYGSLEEPSSEWNGNHWRVCARRIMF